MSAKKKEVAPELVAEGQRLYEQTLAPVHDIAAMMGVSRAKFYRLSTAGGWRRRRASVATFEFARALTGKSLAALAVEEPRAPAGPPADPITTAQRAALAERIQTVVEREIDAVERVLQVITPADQGEAQHSARTIAHLARALREIAALNQPEEVTPSDAIDDDPVPGNTDEFRDALALRIRGFIEARRQRADRVSSGPETPLE